MVVEAMAEVLPEAAALARVGMVAPLEVVAAAEARLMEALETAAVKQVMGVMERVQEPEDMVQQVWEPLVAAVMVAAAEVAAAMAAEALGWADQVRKVSVVVGMVDHTVAAVVDAVRWRASWAREVGRTAKAVAATVVAAAELEQTVAVPAEVVGMEAAAAVVVAKAEEAMAAVALVEVPLVKVPQAVHTVVVVACGVQARAGLVMVAAKVA